jgi:hypothetical protein
MPAQTSRRLFDAPPFPASNAAQVRDTLEDLENFVIDVVINNRRGVRTNCPFPERLKEWRCVYGGGSSMTHRKP